MDTHVAELLRQAEARGEARGRAAVLAEVAKLPSPVGLTHAATDANPTGGSCSWCGVKWTGRIATHPPTICLWARAHAAGVAAPEER
jgi:hypothetical protein